MKKFITAVTTAAIIGLSAPSCTDLDETVYSKISSDDFFNNETEMIMSIGRIYDYMKQYTHYFNIWGANEISSDEAICPFREGNLWWDNGVWVDLHTHNFYPRLDTQAYDFITGGISLCNQILAQIEESPVEFSGKDALTAEVKVMRAWFYLNGIDLYGSIPFTISFHDTGYIPQKDRAYIFEFIEKELLDNVDLLPDKFTTSSYGRPTKAMVYTTLAKLYINADEWIGKEMWQECIEACEKVETFGLELEEDYFANFKAENSGSRENIMVVVYDNTMAPGGWGYNLIFHQVCLYTQSQATFGIVDFCWDGFCATPGHYASYAADDVRRGSWLEGPQYDKSGNPLYFQGEHMTYTSSIRSLYDPQNPAGTTDGVRLCKYEYEDGLMGSMSNDFVIYRYADVLMMHGECLVRQGNKADALPLFNEVRRRAGVTEYTENDLTLDEILAERGREFAFEGLRRQDQIRFGTFLGTWDFKNPSDPTRKLFPIPSWAIAANPTLKQNPGY